jgi:cytosine/adenosine deaminase-related metal-dependent hydrolase
MPLDQLYAHGMRYALGTDVGASPTVSMLAEMGRFLQAHRGKTTLATPSRALYHATRAPADILGLDGLLGSLETGLGRPMSFIEVAPSQVAISPRASADDAIVALIPADLDAPAGSVQRVTLGGRVVYDRKEHHA